MTQVREDLLVSVCLPSAPKNAEHVASLKGLADKLSGRYRYWEIVIAAGDYQQNLLDEAAAQIRNLRILKLRGQPQLYRARVIASSEAIGDIVIITAYEELDAVNIPDFAEEADRDNVIVTASRSKGGFLTAYPLYLLGRSSGFQVEPRDLMTSAYPRTILNSLLARHDSQLALRFPPRGDTTPVSRHNVDAGRSAVRRYSELNRRLNLVQSLLIHASPTVLSLLALFSVIAFIASGGFAVYAIGVYLFLTDVQPGWLTTSLAISGMTAFLGAAMFGLSTGLLHLIELLTPDALEDVADEASGVDLFGQVADDLNVTSNSDVNETSGQ